MQDAEQSHTRAPLRAGSESQPIGQVIAERTAQQSRMFRLCLSNYIACIFVAAQQEVRIYMSIMVHPREPRNVSM